MAGAGVVGNAGVLEFALGVEGRGVFGPGVCAAEGCGVVEEGVVALDADFPS